MGMEAGPDNVENSPEKLIADAATFEELYVALDQIGNIKGSNQTYSSEELKNRIEEVRVNGMYTAITRTHGLREKVHQMLMSINPESE